MRTTFELRWLPTVAAGLALALGTSTVAQSAKAAEPAPTAASDSNADKSADETAIRASAEAYEKAYAAGDAKAIAAGYLEDGEIVAPSGHVIQGREAIEKEFAAIFANQAGAQVKVTISSIRFLSSDVAIESGTTQAISKTAGAAAPVQYTAVQVKRDGKWLLASVNETLTLPTPGEEKAKLAELSFLVGDWQADLGEGKRYESHCQWLPGDTFLSRTFQVTDGGKPLTSGTQIIGFDPELAQIVSWTFDSSGGFGHEIWERRSNGWRIAASSLLPDGATSLATNYLTKGGPDRFTWQSVERSLNDQLLPDTALVNVTRTGK